MTDCSYKPSLKKACLGDPASLFDLADGSAPKTFAKSLCRAGGIEIEILRLSEDIRGGKGAIMLDLAFVVLGFAVIALMGFYAVALRQL